MSNRSDRRVDRALLRDWGLPEPGDSKKSRGDVVVVGGSRRSPGAVLLAAEAALRVGAGRLAALVPASIADGLAIALPEAAVHPLPEDASDPIEDRAGRALRSADAVLVGPGFDDPDETRQTLLAVARCGVRRLVLDAFALGVLPDVERDALPDELILTPNREEAAILLGREPSADNRHVPEVARRYRAVVSCYGEIVDRDGESWSVDAGGPGLGTSGSGDVLAGAVTGFAARGLPLDEAAVWGTWAHARAGDRLTQRSGLGFLARELPAELSPAIAEAAPAG